MTLKLALKKRRPPVLMLSLLVLLSPLAGRRAHGQDAADESTAYTAWYAASEAKEMAKAYALAGEYLAKFPSGQYAEFLKKWLAGARGALFNEAIKAKDMDAMLRVGKERLAESRDDNALQHFETSTRLAATNPVLKTYNSLYCGSLHKQKYDAAVARLKALPEAERGDTPSEAAKAVVAEANREADAAIDCWDRFLALAETQKASEDVRTRIGKTASDLFA